MYKARIIRDVKVLLAEGRFIMEIKAYEVKVSSKFPSGIKLKCILIDIEQGKPRVLLDNHEPFGFHLHTRLPDDPDYRISLDISNYVEAIQIFMREVRRVVSNEN